MKQKIYLSGPMTGYPDYNRPAFFAAEQALSTVLDADFINPARLDSQAKPEWQWPDFMRNSLKGMMDACTIYMLNGWENSRGAKIELELANELGMTVMYQPATAAHTSATENIDWSQAPDGATHFGPEIEGHEPCWFKLDGMKLYFSFHRGMAWRRYCLDLTERRRASLIRRPFIVTSAVDWAAGEERMSPIVQNGPTGEHYLEIGDHLPEHGGYLIGYLADYGVIMSETEFEERTFNEAQEMVALFNDAAISEHGQFSDWRLPTKDQLNLTWVNREKLSALGMSRDVYWWSATEYSADEAWSQNLNSGRQYNARKNASFRVRPVRSVKINELLK